MLKNTYFLFCNQNRKYVIFTKIALFHTNCYFIGKVMVSPMYGFLAGLSSPESIFAEKIRACLITLQSNFEIFQIGHPAVEIMLDRRIFER